MNEISLNKDNYQGATTQSLLDKCKWRIHIQSHFKGLYVLTCEVDNKLPVIAVGNSTNEVLINYLEVQDLYDQIKGKTEEAVESIKKGYLDEQIKGKIM